MLEPSGERFSSSRRLEVADSAAVSRSRGIQASEQTSVALATERLQSAPPPASTGPPAAARENGSSERDRAPLTESERAELIERLSALLERNERKRESEREREERHALRVDRLRHVLSRVADLRDANDRALSTAAPPTSTSAAGAQSVHSPSACSDASSSAASSKRSSATQTERSSKKRSQRSQESSSARADAEERRSVATWTHWTMRPTHDTPSEEEQTEALDNGASPPPVSRAPAPQPAARVDRREEVRQSASLLEGSRLANGGVAWYSLEINHLSSHLYSK